jgi:hypothetical protein
VASDVLGSALRSRRFEHSSAGAVGLADWSTSTAARGRRGASAALAAPKGARRVDPIAEGSVPCAGDADGTEDGTGPDAEPDGRTWLWVRISADDLRGQESSVPLAVVEQAGVRTQSRRTFSSRYGPLTLSYENGEPSRGSVRAVALACGADVGDTLRLGFSARTSDVVVELHRQPADAGSECPPSPDPSTVCARQIAHRKQGVS